METKYLKEIKKTKKKQTNNIANEKENTNTEDEYYAKQLESGAKW